VRNVLDVGKFVFGEMEENSHDFGIKGKNRTNEEKNQEKIVL
jgi:hypothetical protein